MDQQPIEVLYELRCSTPTIYDPNHKRIVEYLCKRSGRTPGRILFGKVTISVRVTMPERRRFLEFLRRHNITDYLYYDDLYKDTKPRVKETIYGHIRTEERTDHLDN